MNVQLPVRMDKTAFLGWVQGRKERYELDRGRVVMMTGGSRAHWQITFNLAKALDARLDPNKWAVLPEFGVDLEPESVRFLDVTVDVAGETAKDLRPRGRYSSPRSFHRHRSGWIWATRPPNICGCQVLRPISYSPRTR
jgi:hypothetical protein